jgi:prepilin-type N-terminal cleavage/methylation domain-containing protein
MMTSRTGTDTAPPRRRATPAARAAFTLVELLVVMGIIGVLVAMLLPAVNRAVIAVRNASCKNRISQIEAGLASFKSDWGVYPPSDRSHEDATAVLTGESPGSDYGKSLLAVALIGPGPEAKGWGKSLENESPKYKLPFGGTSESQVYGPYYQGEFRWTGRGAYIPDAFPSPDRPILYYKFDRRTGTYNHEDNPTGDINEGFQSEQHFELSAKYEAPGNSPERWQRRDYLLICAGADRMYGYIEDTDPPTAARNRNDITKGEAVTDDLTNFD